MQPLREIIFGFAPPGEGWSVRNQTPLSLLQERVTSETRRASLNRSEPVAGIKGGIILPIDKSPVPLAEWIAEYN